MNGILSHFQWGRRFDIQTFWVWRRNKLDSRHHWILKYHKIIFGEEKTKQNLQYCWTSCRTTRLVICLPIFEKNIWLGGGAASVFFFCGTPRLAPFFFFSPLNAIVRRVCHRRADVGPSPGPRPHSSSKRMASSFSRKACGWLIARAGSESWFAKFQRLVSPLFWGLQNGSACAGRRWEPASQHVLLRAPPLWGFLVLPLAGASHPRPCWE